MKRSTLRRLLVLALCLTLVTCTLVGGTLAKYTTSATAADDARVAEWGVVVSAWNTDAADKTTFATSYGTTVNAGADFVAAPGTETPTDGELKFSITGAPEVALKLDVVFTITSEPVVPAGEYLDWTTGNDTTDKYTVAAGGYYPIKFTLTNKSGTKLVDGGNLTAVKTAVDALSAATLAPNTDLSSTYGEYTLTWAWDFDDNGAGTNDKADTTLGNKAAGLTDATASNVVTAMNFGISITATQID